MFPEFVSLSLSSSLSYIVAIRERGHLKNEVNTFLGALRQFPPPEWRGTAAQPTKKSTPFMVPCVSARRQSGEGQMLSQGRSQHLPWCLVSAPRPQSEEGQLLSQGRSLYLHWCLESVPASEEGQLLSQGRKLHLHWCLESVPRVKRDSCSAKEEVYTFTGALSQCPAPRVKRDSCSAKEEV